MILLIESGIQIFNIVTIRTLQIRNIFNGMVQYTITDVYKGNKNDHIRFCNRALAQLNKFVLHNKFNLISIDQ